MPETPFEGIASAHEYVKLLGEAAAEAQETVRDDLRALCDLPTPDRRLEALRIVDYKLAQLRGHIGAASRLLNDLRRLHRLLTGEREEHAAYEHEF